MVRNMALLWSVENASICQWSPVIPFFFFHSQEETTSQSPLSIDNLWGPKLLRTLNCICISSNNQPTFPRHLVCPGHWEGWTDMNSKKVEPLSQAVYNFEGLSGVYMWSTAWQFGNPNIWLPEKPRYRRMIDHSVEPAEAGQLADWLEGLISHSAGRHIRPCPSPAWSWLGSSCVCSQKHLSWYMTPMVFRLQYLNYISLVKRRYTVPNS